MIIFSLMATLLAIHTKARYFDIDMEYSNKESMAIPAVAVGVLPGGKVTMKLQKPDSVLAVLMKSDQATNYTFSGTEIEFVSPDTSDKAFYWLLMKTHSNNIEFPFSVTGSVHVVHDYGELKPEEFRASQYYHCALLIAIKMSIAWCILMYKYRKSLVGHHYAIGLILLVIVVETCMYCLRFLYVNEYGVSREDLDLFALQLAVVRQTLCRLLVILISVGWGITLPSSQITPRMKSELIRLGLVYYIGASIAQYFLFQMTQTDHFGASLFILLVLGWYSFLDAMIVWNVFANLNEILLYLKSEQQFVKFVHYKRFSLALVALIVIAAINNVLCSSLMSRENWFDYFDLIELFRTCSWHAMVLLFLMVVMVLWRPSKESKSYAFAEQITQNENVDGEHGEDTIDIDGEEGDATTMPTAVFVIGEDDDHEADPEIVEGIKKFKPVDPVTGSPLKYGLRLSDTLELTYPTDGAYNYDTGNDTDLSYTAI